MILGGTCSNCDMSTSMVHLLLKKSQVLLLLGLLLHSSLQEMLILVRS